tara:strand:- start:33 stop:500 length:468 start_codon:yes stop_codon:yes gene_type:complete
MAASKSTAASILGGMRASEAYKKTPKLSAGMQKWVEANRSKLKNPTDKQTAIFKQYDKLKRAGKLSNDAGLPSKNKPPKSKPESTPASTSKPTTNYKVTGKTDATMPSNPPGQFKKLGPKNGATRTRKLNGKTITEVYSASLKRWRRQYGRGVGK